MITTSNAPDVDADASAAKWSYLRQRLASAGYAEFIASFNPLSYNPIAWRIARNLAAPKVRLLVDFLLLNHTVSAPELDSILDTSWHVLAETGIVVFERDGWARVPDLVLIFSHGLYLFVDPTVSDPTVYYGDDTIGLSTRLAPGGCRATLDLCSGSGVQALFCGLFAEEATAVEINPQARGTLQLNVQLNGLQQRVDVRGGSLFDEIEPGRRFDLITANPPLVPFPDRISYPFVGHGGHDGLVVTREIIRALPERLTPNGRGQVIGLAFARQGRANIIDEIATLSASSGLDAIMTFLSSRSIEQDTIKSLAATAVSATPQSLCAIEDELSELIRQQQATHLMTFCLSMTIGAGKMSFQNLTRINSGGLWHVI